MDKDCLCMGLFLTFATAPYPTRIYCANDCLAAGLNCHALDPDHVRLSFAAVAIQGSTRVA